MNRDWDIMRNAANGADPYGTTSRMDEIRSRDRERFTSRDRQEGAGNSRMFEGSADYGYGSLARTGGWHGDRDRNDDARFGPRGGYGGERWEGGGPGRYGYVGRGDGHLRGGHGARMEHDPDRGMLGRIEHGIDRAFGRDWEHGRDRGLFDESERYGRGHDDHPSLWQRVKGAFTGKGPKNWTRSDERIREDVCEALTYHPHVDASEIDVVVKDGEVTLTGLVDERRMKRLAEDVAEDVRGVKDVHNQVRVRKPTVGAIASGAQATGGSDTAGGGASGSQLSPKQGVTQTRR